MTSYDSHSVVKSPRSSPGALAVLLLTLSVHTSLAQQNEQFLKGRLLAVSCFQCHSSPGFEFITGHPPREILSEMREMGARRKEIKIMDIVVRAYSEEQLKDIASYLATLPPGHGDDEDED